MRKTIASVLMVAGFSLVGVGTAAAQVEAAPSVPADKVLVETAEGSTLVDRVDTSVDPDGFLPESLPAEARSVPPSCVTAYTDGNWMGSWVDVKNNCGDFQRAKILVSHGLDSQCHQFAPQQTIRHTYPLWARFDGLASC